MNICESNRAVSLEILNFMQNVSEIKEESITDYLAWKWRELDKRFNYLSIQTFNHNEESTTTGADFDLELWIVGRNTHISLAVQAKKLIKIYDRYIHRLNYPNGTKKQMNMLLKYAEVNNKLPFYFFYSIPTPKTKTMCGVPKMVDCGVFMASAKIMEEFADRKHGNRPSRDDLLSKSNPFHCFFCCPLGLEGRYFKSYFPDTRESNSRPNEELPAYVKQLLAESSNSLRKEGKEHLGSNEGWERFRTVGVYDMRESVTRD